MDKHSIHLLLMTNQTFRYIKLISSPQSGNLFKKRKLKKSKHGLVDYSHTILLRVGSYQDLSVFSEPYHPSNAMEGENCCYTPPVGFPSVMISNRIEECSQHQSDCKYGSIWGDFGNGPAPSQCTWMTHWQNFVSVLNGN